MNTQTCIVIDTKPQPVTLTDGEVLSLLHIVRDYREIALTLRGSDAINLSGLLMNKLERIHGFLHRANKI